MQQNTRVHGNIIIQHIYSIEILTMLQLKYTRKAQSFGEKPICMKEIFMPQEENMLSNKEQHDLFLHLCIWL